MAIRCSNCGKRIPFAGKVCPYRGVLKAGDQSAAAMVTVVGIIGAVCGTFVAPCIGTFVGALVGGLIGAVLGAAGKARVQEKAMQDAGLATLGPPPLPGRSATRKSASMGCLSQLVVGVIAIAAVALAGFVLMQSGRSSQPQEATTAPTTTPSSPIGPSTPVRPPSQPLARDVPVPSQAKPLVNVLALAGAGDDDVDKLMSLRATVSDVSPAYADQYPGKYHEYTLASGDQLTVRTYRGRVAAVTFMPLTRHWKGADGVRMLGIDTSKLKVKFSNPGVIVRYTGQINGVPLEDVAVQDDLINVKFGVR